MTEPTTKLSKLLDRLSAGDEIGALRIAARFPSLGREREEIARAWAAHTNPGLYEAMGFDVAATVAAGVEALRRKYERRD